MKKKYNYCNFYRMAAIDNLNIIIENDDHTFYRKFVNLDGSDVTIHIEQYYAHAVSRAKNSTYEMEVPISKINLKRIKSFERRMSVFNGVHRIIPRIKTVEELSEDNSIYNYNRSIKKPKIIQKCGEVTHFITINGRDTPNLYCFFNPDHTLINKKMSEIIHSSNIDDPMKTITMELKINGF